MRADGAAPQRRPMEWRRYAHAKVGDFGAAIADYTLVSRMQCNAIAPTARTDCARCDAAARPRAKADGNGRGFRGFRGGGAGCGGRC